MPKTSPHALPLPALAFLGAFGFAMVPQSLMALDCKEIALAAGADDLRERICAASLLVSQSQGEEVSAEDRFSAARSDYGRILSALYATGYYGPVISITLDGRETANIPPLDAPKRIGKIAVKVDPGAQFRFAKASVAPLAYNTTLSEEFAVGKTAEAGKIETAVSTAVAGWREAGHAKVEVASEDIVADHRSKLLSADVRLAQGPQLRFGPVDVALSGPKNLDPRMDPHRVVKIAGLPEGERFSQSELDDAVARLRRTGIFSTVTLIEGDVARGSDLLPVTIEVTEQLARRYSIGAEIASIDGAALSGMWMHRNLLGGGEKLTVEGVINNIGSGESGVDYDFTVGIERPATLSRNTTVGLEFGLGHLDEVDYSANHASFGLTLKHYFSDELTARAGLSLDAVNVKDPNGESHYRSLSLPVGATWDRRDKATDARRGFYIDAESKSFLGYESTGSGLRLTFDTRGYKSFGARDRMTVAARIQGGAVLNANIYSTPRDELFLSGGGGSVRGHPYRSLGVEVPKLGGGSYTMGGAYMLASSLELRGRVTESIGLVGFVDIGTVGENDFFDNKDGWQAGAGLGLRYETGFGPIRFDVAAPVKGPTGDGVQIYIGLGQAF